MTIKTSFLIQLIAIAALTSFCTAEDGNKVASKASDVASTSSARIFQSEAGSQEMRAAANKNLSRTHVGEASMRAASPDELDAMELTLQRYRTGFESLSLPQIQQVWPGLDHHRASTLKDVFAYLRTSKAAPQLGLECAPPAVIGDSAKVDCRETLAYSDAKGKITQAKPAMVSIQLKKQSDNWVVDTMKGLGRGN